MSTTNAREEGDVNAVTVEQKLFKLYNENVRHLEEIYKFTDFHSPSLNETDFLSKPMVLLLGQYSNGKTSIMRYLIGEDIPGSCIGPEQTTNKFHAVMYGEESGLIDDQSVSTKFPFSLTKPDNDFHKFCRISYVPSPILQYVTFIDTPAIMHKRRRYDYYNRIQWFMDRCDCILIVFDAYCLDISDEVRHILQNANGNENKI